MRYVTVPEDGGVDGYGPPVVHAHSVLEARLAELLDGEDAAAWLLRFGWFGRRWFLVDRVERGSPIAGHHA